jgi:hypothetical protein
VGDRDVLGDHGQGEVQPVDRGRGVLLDAGDHSGQHLAQDAQHVTVVSYESELDVQGAVFRQVPHGVVRLGAEDWPDLVDPLEDSYELLLVELGLCARYAGRPK